MLCLLRRGDADPRRHRADAPPADENENRPLFEKRAPEETATSRSACGIYAARTTVIFGRAFHSRVSFPQDVFFQQAQGVLHDPFNFDA